MRDEIIAHCRELDRCNQRGGRMLSIFDLLDADTLPLNLAAYLASRIWSGASFLTGAVPGGAGKTAVMCALLNFVSPKRTLFPAVPETIRNASDADDEPRGVYICHEIGMGSYFAYLWGRELRTFITLAENGHQLATNLHANDLDEAHAQICGDNKVPEPHFRAFNLLIFLRITGGYVDRHHWVEKVYESKHGVPHELIYDVREGLKVPEDDDVSRWRLFLENHSRAGIRTIEETRTAVLQTFSKPEPKAKTEPGVLELNIKTLFDTFCSGDRTRDDRWKIAAYIRSLFDEDMVLGNLAYRIFINQFVATESVSNENEVKSWMEEEFHDLPPDCNDERFQWVDTEPVKAFIKAIYASPMKVVPWCVVEYIIDHLSNTEAMYLIKALLEEYIYDERRVNDLLYGMQFLFNDSEHDAPLLKMIEIVEAYVEIENESIADYARCIAHGMRTNLEEGTR